MKLSTRTRYGTRALMELALRNSDEPVLLKEIARKQEISLAYLEHIISPLVTAGILRSAKGPKGGVALARKPEDIKLIEITRLLEGSMALVECINAPDLCSRASFCATRDVWSELKEAIDGVLESMTLKDLADKQKEKGQPALEMYYI